MSLNVESLDEEYFIEDIPTTVDSDAEEDAVFQDATTTLPLSDDEQIETAVEAAAIPVPAPIIPKKVNKSKRKLLTFDDLGIDAIQSQAVNYTQLLDDCYEKQPKPLYVKTHTKVKVLIVCANALRCLEVIKELRSSMPKVMVAKLFSKHMKVAEQVDMLHNTSFLVGVGTAARMSKIMETDKDALKAKRIEFLIIDGTYRDKKSMSIYDLPETHLELKKLVESVHEFTIGIYSF